MRIWILNHYATESLAGGRHYNLALELSEKGYEVSVFAAGFLHNQFYETREYGNRIFDCDVINGVEYIWLKTYPYDRNNWRRFLNMISFAIRVYKVGKTEPAPDVIIASSVHPLTWISGYKLARKHRSRFIVEVRDLWPETLINMGAIKKNSIPARLMRKLEQFMYTRAEKIITLLPEAHKYITTLGIERDKIIYVPNGANPEIYEIDDKPDQGFDEYLQKYPAFLDESKFKVVYTGAHGVVNSIETAIQAADILQRRGIDNICFLLVGAGPEKDNLIEMANKLRLKNVEFCNQVPRSTVPYILSCAECCLLLGKDIPLYQYGISPNKLFDYLASSKPIVFAGNVVNNIVDIAKCGITVPPEEYESLADALIELSQMSKSNLEEMGKNGRQYFMENHTYQALADKLEKEVILS
ncbi:MAG: glycosyltransferase family 4 protein [Syntrophomonadaceae bacterium]|nr:glycosyltransferase family 4 protein [Syntrophomonadaceae bacterium]